MTQIQESIPDSLRAEVEAALDWFNAGETTRFEVTGILDPDASLADTGPRELRLVLCGGDRCEQHSFQVRSGETGYEVAFASDGAIALEQGPSLAPELDPPPGALRGWIERILPKHRFSVLLFYRGYW